MTARNKVLLEREDGVRVEQTPDRKLVVVIFPRPAYVPFVICVPGSPDTIIRILSRKPRRRAKR